MEVPEAQITQNAENAIPHLFTPKSPFCSKMTLRTGWGILPFDPVCWHLVRIGTPSAKSTLKVYFLTKKKYFPLIFEWCFSCSRQSAQLKNIKNTLETEAAAKAEAWAGRVHGGNNCGPLSDNCYEASTAWKVVAFIFAVKSTCYCLCP